MSLVAWPEAHRRPGVYVGAPVWVPWEARQVTLELTGRETWGRLGVGQTVLTVALECNIAGQWVLLSACTMDLTPLRGRDPRVAMPSTLGASLPAGRIPLPQVRGVVQCASPCQFAGQYVFEV